jgi:hypothetical protein
MLKNEKAPIERDLTVNAVTGFRKIPLIYAPTISLIRGR